MSQWESLWSLECSVGFLRCVSRGDHNAGNHYVRDEKRICLLHDVLTEEILLLLDCSLGSSQDLTSGVGRNFLHGAVGTYVAITIGFDTEFDIFAGDNILENTDDKPATRGHGC